MLVCYLLFLIPIGYEYLTVLLFLIPFFLVGVAQCGNELTLVLFKTF